MKSKFKGLIIYLKTMAFGNMIDVQTKKFPTREMFGLASQFLRAEDSFALNIAEGSGGGDNQFYNYLGNA